MGELLVEINGRTAIHNGYFAYEGCHKMYILEDEEDIKQATEFQYSVLPMEDLEETYKNSCPLRFISNWKLTERYVPQFYENEMLRDVTFNYVQSA